MSSGDKPCYLFAYGSLIWRPDFAYTQRWQACLSGFERRFWQASHDHRGTPDMPGRVLTLVPMLGGHCDGVLYLLPDEHRDEILFMLDEREQDGYERHWLQVAVENEKESVTALTWLAAAGNPSWAGEQPLSELAQLIAERHGPSGSNIDYLMHLHSAFAQMGIKDVHVEELVGEVERQSKCN